MGAATDPQWRRKAFLSFAAVYIIWGSTYLAFKFGVDTFPPFLLGGFRFLIAGPLLLLLALGRGQKFPTKAKEYFNCAVVGFFLLLAGNGVLVWSAQFVQSGLLALIAATVPFWMAAIEAMWPGGERPGRLGVVGLILGFCGVLLLIWPDLREGLAEGVGAGDRLLAQLLCLGSCSLWAFGTIYARHATLPRDPLMGNAFQMIFGALSLFVAGTLFGEWENFSWEGLSTPSLVAVGYLILVASCIGFPAFIWLLRNVPASKVATHAYVNPVVAVFLGWWVLDEGFHPFTWVGMTVVLCGVILVTRDHKRSNPIPQKESSIR